MTIGVMYSPRSIIYFNPISCSKFKYLIWCIVQQIYNFFIFNYYIIVLILSHHNLLSFLLEIFIFLFVFRYYCQCFLFQNYFVVNFLRLLWFYQQFCYRLNLPFLPVSFELTFFWSSFNCICCKFFSVIKKFLTVFYT